MKNARAALRYAKALLNLAISTKDETNVNNDMKSIVTTIVDSKELDTMLQSPIIKASDKAKVLTALFGNTSTTITKGLFNLLQENKRMMMLESIARKYTIVYDRYKNTQVAKVTTAVALTKELEDKIQAKIVSLTGNKASIENIIKPEIIGGFILQVGDKQFDASIASKFNSLQQEFDNNKYQLKN